MCLFKEVILDFQNIFPWSDDFSAYYHYYLIVWFLKNCHIVFDQYGLLLSSFFIIILCFINYTILY